MSPDEHDPPVPDALRRLTHELAERVKELNCLFGISEIVEESGGSLDRILERTATLLAASWEHPDITIARITLGEREAQAGSGDEAVASQAADIVVHGERMGSVEISYSEPRPVQDEGPFTTEERRLLNAVAERLGQTVERLTAQEYMTAKEEEFRRRITHVTRVSTMGELASSIAHEVNQPLTAIANYSQACHRLVAGGMLEAFEVLDVLDKIGDEALRAGEIIRRLRSLVQRRETKMEKCDLSHLLREIGSLASVDARLNDVELRTEVPRKGPTVLADGVQIQQVVLNLIRNGIDAMVSAPAKHGVLEVRVDRQDDGQVRVSVVDQGEGLPELDEGELFEPFFTTKEAGLGLGLSISRSIIDAHGGRLSFFRNTARGSTFYFDLPIAEGT